MRKVLAATLFAVVAANRCASNPNSPGVRVTRDRSLVKTCVGLSRVATEIEGEAAEKDLKRQTADLGGNVLLLVTERSGDAYYCENPPPPEVTIPGASPAPHPTPLRPS